MLNSDSQEIDELAGQLHQASDKFHESRQHLEQAMDGAEYRHQARVDGAQTELREAEKKVEEVEERISKALNPQESQSGD